MTETARQIEPQRPVNEPPERIIIREADFLVDQLQSLQKCTLWKSEPEAFMTKTEYDEYSESLNRATREKRSPFDDVPTLEVDDLKVSEKLRQAYFNRFRTNWFGHIEPIILELFKLRIKKSPTVDHLIFGEQFQSLVKEIFQKFRVHKIKYDN